MSGDFAIHEASELVVALRGDLRVTPQQAAGQPHYVLEDPLRGRFFRVGPREYELLSQLDGRTTLAEAVARTAGSLGPDALSSDEAVAIGRWLVENELATTPASISPARLEAAWLKQAARIWRARLNPLFARMPLFNPDRAVSRLAPWLGWLFSGPCVAIWLAVCLMGGWVAMREAAALAIEARTIVQPRTWLGLGIVWIVLKIMHELAHAVACKKYGGTVPRAGVQFVFFAPLAYVDVTSSWRFASKWQRIVVSAGGMYVELFAAAVALLIWSWTEPGLAHQTAHQVVLLAGLAAVLINANPLMRFDGYYILCDWLEIPNLYGSGGQYVAYLFQRYVLGRDASLPDWPAGAGRWIRAYGVAASAWRLLVMLVLTLGLVGVWPYLGGMLAAALWTSLLAAPLIREVRRPVPWRSWRRPAVTMAALAGLLGGAIAILGRPGHVSAWGVVEYGPLHILRAASAGFVREIYVRDGEEVTAGHVVLVLENKKLHAELADLKLSIRQSQLRQQQHLGQQEYARLDVEMAQQEALEKRRQEIEKQVASLVVRAPSAGRIIRRDLDALLGQYFKAGESIAMIGNDDAKELVVGTPQDDIEPFRSRVGHEIEIRPYDRPFDTVHGTMVHVEPRATVEPPHAALSAVNGGPLAVQARREAEGEVSGDAETGIDYELLGPVFKARVDLERHASRQFAAGQLVVVRFKTAEESTARRVWRSLRAWIDRQMNAAISPTENF